ncbi:hypothetical protein [Phytohabitans rumicis]|uniref:Uncharacterized protein n=1 Tax=Phytohabitans rumicis TaxID=1076125 RepID=A0A6V8LCP3_9ACTN|nr:hypothetical protein [Phytohabitans rumicis]GFJ93440.1 hypothetical protein Prum_070820 [Phytohabitans rumicis]
MNTRDTVFRETPARRATSALRGTVEGALGPAGRVIVSPARVAFASQLYDRAIMSTGSRGGGQEPERSAHDGEAEANNSVLFPALDEFV